MHARGLRIIGDLTTNHSGDDHPWFTTALTNPDAPERRFYYVADDGCYAAWLGIQTLPKFDLESPALAGWTTETLLESVIFGATEEVVAATCVGGEWEPQRP